MKNLLKILHSLFVKGPLGILMGILQLIFLLILFIPSFLSRFYEFLLKFLKKRNFKEEEENEKDCNPPFPEAVLRRPDPCIYSQKYLAGQGLPVTWNNPDIWMAKAATPAIIEPDSYHLADDTDYIVFVRVHNASTDLGLGVKVRLLYRPWSFNSPDLLPVQVNNANQEVIRYVNVPGMGSNIAQFLWHTPPVAPGQTAHYCLQAHVSHPLDINPENNMGQENTNVYSSNPGHVTAGELIQFQVPLFNHTRKEHKYFFEADSYRIEKERKIELVLTTNTGHEKWPIHKRIVNFSPNRHLSQDKRWQLKFFRQLPAKIIRARYAGFDSYENYLHESKFALPDGMKFNADIATGGVLLKSREQKAINFQLQVPNHAADGDEYSINIRAHFVSGRLVGGVTLLLTVKN